MAKVKLEIEQRLLLDILETLRLAHIYALLGSEFQDDELGDDFKAHKWKGYEKEYATTASAQYQALLTQMEGQVRPEPPEVTE